MNALEIKLSDGVRLAVPASLASITTYVLLEQEAWFEKELDFLRAWLKPGMTVIDIGANLGTYSLLMARLVGETGRAFAYEPGTEARGLLERSRDLNGATHLHISPQALSDRPRDGRLVFGASSELNALGERGDGEAIAITSLDAEDAAQNWTPDFVKIDAEGQEEAILAGGQSFFARHSPLVMFEIKALADVNERLRALFPDMGYRLFRQLAGAPILVPDDATLPLDSYELNLFGAKRDRIDDLARRGLLVDAIAAWTPTDANRRDGHAFWQGQSFTQRANMTGWTTPDPVYAAALAAYAAWRATDRPASERCAALAFAVRALKAVCQHAPTPARLSTLARVAWEWGARDASVAALQQLLNVLPRRAVLARGAALRRHGSRQQAGRLARRGERRALRKDVQPLVVLRRADTGAGLAVRPAVRRPRHRASPRPPRGQGRSTADRAAEPVRGQRRSPECRHLARRPGARHGRGAVAGTSTAGVASRTILDVLSTRPGGNIDPNFIGFCRAQFPTSSNAAGICDGDDCTEVDP
jgi:FkbM family methyltransferase